MMNNSLLLSLGIHSYDLSNVVVWYLDWVVAYQGPIKRPTGTSTAGQVIVILAKIN